MDAFLAALPPVLVALIAPLSALGGALGGVALTNRHARKREDTQRKEDRKSSVREIALELVFAALDWNGATQSYSMMLIASANGGGAPTDEPVMEAGLKLAAARTRLLRAFSAYRLTISDSALVSAGDNLREVFDSTTAITSPLLAPALRGQRVTNMDGFNALFDHVRDFPERVSEFEKAVAQAVAGPIN